LIGHQASNTNALDGVPTQSRQWPAATVWSGLEYLVAARGLLTAPEDPGRG
jgi:hypothetical protein